MVGLKEDAETVYRESAGTLLESKTPDIAPAEKPAEKAGAPPAETPGAAAPAAAAPATEEKAPEGSAIVPSTGAELAVPSKKGFSLPAKSSGPKVFLGFVFGMAMDD